MPSKLIPHYAVLALSLSAVLSIPMFALPAFAFPALSIELGFLESIDDPSKLHMRAANEAVIPSHPAISEEAGDSENSPVAWQRGLGPVWVWNPSVEITAPAVIASH